MAYAAGLLGFLWSNAAEAGSARMREAIRRAPWRGAVAATVGGPQGALYALGSAQAARHQGIGVAFHGRLDNIYALQRQLGLDQDADVCAVVAEAYLRLGDEFAARLIGDFAVLVLDERNGVLLGARDWVGARPLFWGQHGAVSAAASEVKQVLALLDRPYELDEVALAAYEQMMLSDITATFAKGILAVPPNGQIRAQGTSPVRAWRRPIRFAPLELSMAEAAAALRRQLEVAVARRVAGAHRLGALISGGMDSTSVAATASSLADRGIGPPVRASFTTAYPDVPAIDETAYAREVAERWGIPWTPVVIRPADLMTWPDRGFIVHDGPTFPGFGMYNTLMTAAQEQGVDVLLTGSGGDYWIRQDGRELQMAILRGDIRAILQWGLSDVRHTPRRTARRALGAVVRRVVRGERAEDYYESRATDYWLRTAFECTEREGMRHGLRVEHPFGDFELACLLAGLPPRLRSLPATPLKLATRTAMKGLLPEIVRTRMDNPVSTPFFVIALGGRARDGEPLGDGNVLTQTAARYGEAWRRLARSIG